MGIRFHALLKQSSALTSVALLALATAQTALANPEGGNVVAGSATISTPDAVTLRVDQATDRAIINWDSFNIAAGETTRFALPSAESWTLNRVVGSQDPSRIHGSLISNGNLVVVNPDGFHFGSGATVDVNRLIATTADIGNDAFMAGQFRFTSPGNPSASIVNEGTISIADYGLAALVAPSVRNSGVIGARLGTVSLAAGNSFTIDPYGDGLINFTIGDEIAAEVYDAATGEAVSDLVGNDGKLSADGGTVAMTSATARRAVNSVVNNTGVVEARSVGVQNGMIVLGGATAATKPVNAPAQTVRVSGTLDARGADPVDGTSSETPIEGGYIEITGEAIAVKDAAIDASGRDGGGTILIGGDYRGGDATNEQVAGYGITMEDEEIATATYTFLTADAKISADALESGDGGKVIVWSNDSTLTSAEISARGGAVSGDGGFIETSGHKLSVLTAADASAPNGRAGVWLLDPADVTIATFGNSLYSSTPYTFVPDDWGDIGEAFNSLTGMSSVDAMAFEPTANGSLIDVGLLETALNAGTSAEVTTYFAGGTGNGNIFLAADVNKTSGGDAFLALTSVGNISVANGVDIASSSGDLFVMFWAEGNISGSNVGEIDLGNGGGLLLTSGGDIDFSSNFDMPNLALLLDPMGWGSGTREVSVSFDDDRLDFSYSASQLYLPSYAIDLRDATAYGNLAIALGDINTRVDWALANLAIIDPRMRFGYFENEVGYLGVDANQMLDGIPEIVVGDIGSEYIIREYADNPNPFGPVVELGATSHDVSAYFVTHESGEAILDAYLNSIAPPPPPPPEPKPAVEVPQVVLDPQPFIGPVRQQPEQQVLFGIPELDSDIPLAMDLGEMAQTTIAYDVLRLSEEPSALAARHDWAIESLFEDKRVSDKLEKMAEKYAAAYVSGLIGGGVGSVIPGAGTFGGAAVGVGVGYYAAVFKQELESYYKREMERLEAGADTGYYLQSIDQATRALISAAPGIGQLFDFLELGTAVGAAYIGGLIYAPVD